jgi:hypothetical protein
MCFMPTQNRSASILAQLLRPAVRFALRRGVKVRAIVHELKTLLIEEANHELARRKEDVTVSKLSVMTGLQRRDAQRVTSSLSEPAEHLDLLTRIIGAWGADERFSRASKARDLTVEGSESEFAQLVKSVSLDLNPATVLFELERLGLVERTGDCLRLLWSSYQISGDIDDAYLLLQRDINTLVEAVDLNIRKVSPVPNLHISTHFDNVSTEALPKIREWVLKRGAAFHAEVREFVGSFDKDLNPTLYNERGGVKVTVGSFSLCDSAEASDAEG